MMLRIRSFLKVIILFLYLGWAGSLHAQKPDLKISNASVRKEVIAVIEGQLNAFRIHDLDKAFSYASRSLQSHLPQAVFMTVTKQNYPEIWSNKSADFGLVKDNQLRSSIQVRVVSEDGSNASYDYDLSYEHGVWKIEGILRHQQKKTPGA
jgi:hypothetical protein